MKSVLVAAAVALALSGGAAFAQGAGGSGGSGAGGGNGPAIGNSTTTSMGAPKGSPSYTAPRSAAVPGLSQQQRTAQQRNAVGGRHVDQGATTPVQGPTGLNGRTQTNP